MEKDILAQPNIHKLYNTQAFTIATILGGPLAAAYMASSNFNHLGETKKAGYTWAVGILLVCIAIVLPEVPGLEAIPSVVHFLLLLFIVQVLVHRFQAKKIAQHVSDGGSVYPVSRAVVVGLLFLIGLLVLIFGAMYAIDSIMGEIE